MLSSFNCSSLSLNAAKISQEECASKVIILYLLEMSVLFIKKFSGDEEGSLNIIVHGTWNEGTDTLARYAPFEDLSMRTDITTIAVALPGYSGSSQIIFHPGCS